MKTVLIRLAGAFAGALLLAAVLLGVGHAQAPHMRPALSSNLKPTWSIDLRAGLPAGSTFTRASSRSCWGSNGVLATISTNVPCFHYDPATGQSWGYLAEMQSTNNVRWSSDGTQWTMLNVSQSTDGTLGPDGVTLARLITATAGAGSHYATGGLVSGYAAGSTASRSIFVKQGSTRYVQFGDSADSIWHTATFDFQTGTWQSSNSATTAPPQQLSGGWWRLSISVTMTNATGSFVVTPMPATGLNTVPSYTATGTETVYVTGLQAETVGVGTTSYIPTAGSTVTRSVDLLTLPLSSVPGWNPNKGGVLAATYRLHTNTGSVVSQVPVAITDGVGANYIIMEAQSGGHGGNSSTGILTRSGNVIQINQTTPSGGVSAPSVRKRQAIGWGVARGQMASDSVMRSTISGSYLLPTSLTTVYLGGVNEMLGGTLEGVSYYADTRSDSDAARTTR